MSIVLCILQGGWHFGKNLGKHVFVFLCVVKKNKNVRDPFASVTGRRPALPPGSAAALASLARVLEHPVAQHT